MRRYGSLIIINPSEPQAGTLEQEITDKFSAVKPFHSLALSLWYCTL